MKFKIICWLILFFTSCFAQHQSDFLVLLGKGEEDNGMQFTFSGSTAFQLDNMRGTGDVTFDWGDGTTTTYTLTSSDQTISHTYSDTTKKTVRIDKPELITKWVMSNNAGKWNINFDKLPNLTYLYIYSVDGAIIVNSADVPSVGVFYVLGLSGSVCNINTSDISSCYDFYIENINGTFVLNPRDIPNAKYFRASSLSGTIDISYTSHTWVDPMQHVYINVSSGGLTSCEIDAMYADLANVSTWTGGVKILSVIGNGNADRTTASDADKAAIVAKNVTVTDNGNEGTCP